MKIIYIGLALIILMPAVSACSLFGGGDENGGTTVPPTVGPTTPVSTEVPVVEINRVAPNNLDLPGITEVVLATPEEGALLVNENARVWVPPGAVVEDTPVTIERFLEPPQAITSNRDDAIEVSIISEFYDLGPDNTLFDNPVIVTLAYPEDVLPAGADENLIAPIYFDGENWVAIECQLDTVNNTVTFETNSFPGVPFAVAFGIPLGKLAVGGITTVFVGTMGYLGYLGYGHYVKDPVHWGKAGEYVTPNDATVQQWADRAQINLTYGSPPHPVNVKDMLADPEVLKEFIDSGEGFIQFENNESIYANPIKPVYRRDWNPNDWQKPDYYFNNGMVGDCKNVANAMASIFRHYGYQAKCTDGYMVNDEGQTKRHGWLEVIIDGKPYYVGSHAEIMPLDQAVKQYTLTRPKGIDGEGYYWDEHGQKLYVENWWEYYLEVEVNRSLAFPGGEVTVDVFGPTGVALDIQLTLENPVKTKTVYTGVTDETNGEVRFTLDLAIDALLDVYYVTAYNAANNISDVGIFCVTPLEISAVLVSSKVVPGEMLQIKARFNKPISADIWVGEDAVWTTDAAGFVDIVRTITPDTPLGPYTLTLSAPEYGITKTINYAVWIPATLKVNITPEVNSPGKEFYVNVLIEPAQVTRITMRGYSGQWMTDQDGRLNILMHVLQTTAPGVYEIVMEAPDLGLTASDTHTVMATPEINLSDITIITAELSINCAGSDEDSEWEAYLTLGGQYIRVSGVNNLEIFASGTVQTNAGPAEMYYTFTLNQDLTRIISGHVSLVADSASYSFDVYDVPMNAAQEDSFRAEWGMEALIFSVQGTSVSNHYGAISVNEPALGSIARYFTDNDSTLIITLVVATESQITDLLGD